MRNLLSIKDLSKEEIILLIEQGFYFKEINKRPIKKVPTLRGKTVVTCFYEPSTRTRLSFEIAAKRLSADTMNISKSGSSVEKGETLVDTVKNIEAMSLDLLIMRHPATGAPHLASQVLKCPVVNAGDGINEHPTQALLDAMTIYEKRKTLDGLKVIIIGDILHSRVARSNIFLLNKFNIDIYVYAPPMMLPKDIEKLNVKVVKDLKKEIKNADVVMMLRVQMERQSRALFPSIREYSNFYGFSYNMLQYLKKDAILMHPGPINRGVELNHFAADSEFSVILDQVENGVALRMAVLYMLIGSSKIEN
jgi:aspartate carbamoyltransferase catalytic subunit